MLYVYVLREAFRMDFVAMILLGDFGSVWCMEMNDDGDEDVEEESQKGRRS